MDLVPEVLWALCDLGLFSLKSCHSREESLPVLHPGGNVSKSYSWVFCPSCFLDGMFDNFLLHAGEENRFLASLSLTRQWEET